MPIIQAAKKALRQSEKRRVLNLKRKRAMKDVVKTVRSLASEKKAVEAEKLLPEAYKAIDKAAKRGVIKKNTADRKKSRLTKFVAKSK